MNRGSIVGRALANRLGSFNEAPIHESGKSGRAIRRATSRAGFNEAPIHESGKCPVRKSTQFSVVRLQ